MSWTKRYNSSRLNSVFCLRCTATIAACNLCHVCSSNLSGNFGATLNGLIVIFFLAAPIFMLDDDESYLRTDDEAAAAALLLSMRKVDRPVLVLAVEQNGVAIAFCTRHANTCSTLSERGNTELSMATASLRSTRGANEIHAHGCQRQFTFAGFSCTFSLVDDLSQKKTLRSVLNTPLFVGEFFPKVCFKQALPAS